MCSQTLSDKGWLRQYLPNPTPDQLYNFIERVGLMLDSYQKPTERQVETARQYAYRQLMGGLAV